MEQRFATEHWVPYPVELVFAFFANPANLPHLMPPALQTRIEDARIQAPPARPAVADPARRFRSVAAGAGSEILISFHPLAWVPRRMSFLVRIEEFAWNSHILDEQVRGPFERFRHRRGITAETRDGQEGTRVCDEIDYGLPLLNLGVLGGLLARRRMAGMFAYRQRKLPQILEVASRQAVRRS